MKNLFKYASLLLAAAMLFACEKPGNGGSTDDDGELVITPDKTIIQTFGGDYALLTVTLGDEVLTEGVMFFDGENNPIEIPGFKFSATEPGEHVIWANYGTAISEKVTIKAISVEIPQTPADPKPESTDFKARVLVTEFTTTGCTYCPGMKDLIHGAMEDATVADRVVFTACHSGLINSVKDPAYIRTEFDDFAKSTGFPYMFCDMYYGFGYYSSWSVKNMADILNQLYDNKKDVAAGLAVTSSVVDGQLVAKVTVKAAETGNYRIGAFLLEDGIYGRQSNSTADWQSRHDGVIRHIDSREMSGVKETYYGHSVGKVEAGKTADYIFIWNLNQIWADGTKYGEIYGGTPWGNEADDATTGTFRKGMEEFVAGKDLHIAVFATTAGTDLDGNEVYYISNAVDSPINGQTPYQYR